MPTEPRSNPTPQRVSVRTLGAVGACTLAVMLVIGGAAALVNADRSRAKTPDLADQAKLAIQMQPPKPSAAPSGRLQVLDTPELQRAVLAAAPPPELQSLIDQERREQARMVAEQRAFDSRIRAEIAASYQVQREDPGPPVVRYASDYERADPHPDPRMIERREPPSHWTSNTEDRSDDPG